MENLADSEMSHDQLVAACAEASNNLDPQQVGRAFVASLSSRRLDWRGVLAAYAVCRQLPSHQYSPTQIFNARPDANCSVCGLQPDSQIVSGRLLVDNLGRAYYLGDSLTSLQQFADTEKPVPTAGDIEMLTQMIDRLRNRPKTKLGELQKLIQGLFPSNKFERVDILGTLALAGIFNMDADTYWDGWVTYDVRESIMPSHFYAKDSTHPLRHYAPDCQVNEAAVSFWFSGMATNAG